MAPLWNLPRLPSSIAPSPRHSRWSSLRPSARTIRLPQVTFDASSTPGEAEQDGVDRLLLGPITVAGHERYLAITTMLVSSRPCRTSKRDLTTVDVPVITGLYASGPATAASSCGAHIAKGSDTHGGALAASCLLACGVARRLRRRQPGRAR